MKMNTFDEVKKKGLEFVFTVYVPYGRIPKPKVMERPIGPHPLPAGILHSGGLHTFGNPCTYSFRGY